MMSPNFFLTYHLLLAKLFSKIRAGVEKYYYPPLHHRPSFLSKKIRPLKVTLPLGHATLRSSLLGSFLCLINYPKVIRKIQKEIDNVIGDRPPTVKDKASMPYTSAFILELLRFVSQVLLSATRVSTEDFTFEGFTIPKGTDMLLTWFFHRDENTWEDTWTFKPDRFLSSNGQLLGADDPVRKNLLPFGAGPRSCPGEVFARTRVFLVLTNVLQKYDLLPPANEKLVPADFSSNEDCVQGNVRQIQPYKCRLQKRQKISH